MSATPGSRIGPFHVISLLGAGGMGQVYRARDSRLNRDVAIKVLPPALSGDGGRMARFAREAQLLAALNHTNIAAVYGLEECEGAAALVMELVEGQTLAERILAGPVPLDEALPVARQIVEALEAAHEKGIVHRDLKPANIKITPEGKVKVLDFGLAKAFESDGPTAGPAAADSPTLTLEATRAGQIMGTAAYMSPEQARGRPVDRRADVWAFGVVLYEMLTGMRMFEGETVSDILAGVLRADIDLTRLPPETPSSVRRLLLRCLRRNPKERLRDIGDARIEIDSAEEPAPAPVVAAGSHYMLWLPWAVAAVLAAVLLWVVLRPVPAAPPQPVARWVLPKNFLTSLFSVSRDGSRIVYYEPAGLMVRRLDELEGKRLPLTEGAGILPEFSPDGQWILYGTDPHNQLKKVQAGGGTPVTICEGSASWGTSWGDDDTILFSNGKSLLRVPASGGVPEQVTTPDPKEGTQFHMAPQMLPGSRQAIFTILTMQDTKVGLLDLRSKTYRVIARGGGRTRYVPSGHLVYYRGTALFATPFDLRRMAVVGNEVPVIEGVAANLSTPGMADYSVSDTGLLVYASFAGKRGTTLAWLDRNGTVQPITATTQWWGTGRLSPEGRRVANTLETPTGELDVWVLDTARATTTRVTRDGKAQDPIWSPDGRRILYGSTKEGKFGIYETEADGSGTPELLLTGDAPATPTSMTPDGRTLVYSQQGVDESWHLMLQTRGAQPRRFHQNGGVTHSAEYSGELSPDGKWLAYCSMESGWPEIYVERFPESGGKTRISSHGGMYPRWARDMRNIYYVEGVPAERLMGVRVQTGAALTAGPPTKVAEYSTGTTWDVAPDDKRFLVEVRANPNAPVQNLVVVTNWFNELRRKAPPHK